MAFFTGTAASETITPSTVSGTVTRSPLGSLPSAEADTIFGHGGTDTLDGGEGDDSIVGGSGNDTIFGGQGDDQINAAEGDNVIDGGDGSDHIESGAGADIITGGLGRDVILAGTGADQVDGGEGDDSIFVSTEFVSVNGGMGYDDLRLSGTSGRTLNLVTIGVESVTCGDGDDTIDGSGLTQGTNLYGNLGDDVLMGSAVSDYISGGDGNNTVVGNAGNDTILNSRGDDRINGGSGTDRIWCDDLSGSVVAGVTIDLSLTTAQNTGGAGTDILIGIEDLSGTRFNDTLTGTVGNNMLAGFQGTDTVSYANAVTGVTVNLSLTTAQNTVGAGTDMLFDFENLRGSNFNDRLTGTAGNNVLDGGIGTDTVSYANALTGVTVNLSLTTAQNTVGAGTDTLLGVENLIGSNFNDTLTGNAGANSIEGGGGDDTIDGQSGNDTVQGGAGNDVLTGGTGYDLLTYAAATAAVTVNLTTPLAQNTEGAGTDTIAGFENLTGSAFNDTLTGNATANILDGKGGDDLLNGGAGTDTAHYGSATAAVTVNLSLAGAQNTGAAGVDTLVSLENLIGTAFHDTLTGSSGNNVLNGLAGNDTLTGLDGHDTLKGGLGNDTLTGNSGADSFVFNQALNATTNKDTIPDFSPVDDTLLLENAIFTKFTANGAIPAGTFVANAGGVAGDANDFLLYDNATGKLFYDADGNGAGAKIEFVTLVGIPALTAGDFSII